MVLPSSRNQYRGIVVICRTDDKILGTGKSYGERGSSLLSLAKGETSFVFGHFPKLCFVYRSFCGYV